MRSVFHGHGFLRDRRFEVCEYVDKPAEESRSHWVAKGAELDVGGGSIHQLHDLDQGYWECWHPETQGWEVMLQPPEGMSLKMSPGSKIRFQEGTPPDKPSKNTPPEKITAGQKMRDLV
jgi:hypothetical protein